MTHAGEHGVAVGEALQADGELHIAGAHDVLHLEVLEVRGEAQLLDDLGILRAQHDTPSASAPPSEQGL